MKRWYVLNCLTGDELRVVEAAMRLGDLTALCPMEWRDIRRGGKVRKEPYIYLPGYVFIHTQMTVTRYYELKTLKRAIRLLGADAPESVPEHEMQLIIALARRGAHDYTAMTSDAGTPADDALGTHIVRYNKRQRRATVRVPILGQSHDITLTL